MNIKLTIPIKEEDIRKLKLGDIVYLTGIAYTVRDEAHMRMLEKGCPVNLDGGVVFHCGPIMKKINDKWEVVAAGPTTSSRMNTLQPKVIEKFRIRGIIGKGGMDRNTLDAMGKYGCVYFAITGGAAVLAAKGIESIENVYWLDLGMPEALWVCRLKDFGPLVVAMDTNGNSIYADVDKKVQENLLIAEKKLGIINGHFLKNQ